MSIQNVKEKFIHTNRTSEPLQEFQNVRIILLDSMWELLLNAQRNSSDLTGSQALNSLTKCMDILDDCLKSLQDSDYDLSNTYRTLIARTAFCKFDIKILDKYINSLEDAIGDYVEDQGAFQDMQHKDAAKKTLEIMLKENIGIIQLAIQMLEFLTDKDKSSLLKLSGSVVWNTLKIHQGVEIPKKTIPESDTNEMKEGTSDLIIPMNHRNNRLSGGKCLGKLHRKESVYSKFYSRAFQKLKKSSVKIPSGKSHSSKKILSGIKKFRIEASKHLGQFSLIQSKYILKDTAPTRASFGVSRFQTDSMREATLYIIDTFLSLKSSSRSSAKCDRYLTRLKTLDHELGDIWLELCEKHQQILFNSSDSTSKHLKNTLAHFYLTKMQILLQNNLGKLQFDLPMIGSQMILTTQSMLLPENRVIDMHKTFYTIQLEKLRKSRKTFNASRLYKMIMHRMVPEIQSDYELLKQYETDPEHYNVLMMMINTVSQRENLLNIFHANFEEIKRQMHRERRHKKMHKILELKQKRQDSSYSESDALLYETQIVFDDDFLEQERAKWAKFFNEPEKSNLEEKSLAEQKVNARKQKILQERKKRQGMKCIVSLYTAPRLTHRMRRAMEQIAEEKSPELGSQSQQKKVLKKEETLKHSLTDAILESDSWLTYCCKCQSLHNKDSCESALDIFHRIYQQILNTTTYC